MIGSLKKYFWRDHDCLYRILFEAIQDAIAKERLGRPYQDSPDFGNHWIGETERFAVDREQRLYLTRPDEDRPAYILHLPDKKKEPYVERVSWDVSE